MSSSQQSAAFPHNPKQHAAYVGSWIKSLQEDKNEIFRVAKDAHKAADFILGLEKSKTVEKAETQLRTETWSTSRTSNVVLGQ